MTNARELLVEWLRDAHAAEEQAQTLFSRTSDQVETNASFMTTLKAQSGRSAEHAEQIKRCLEGLGEGPSLIKTVTGQVVALAQSISGYVVEDQPVKAVLATATFARMQVVSFQILTTSARAIGEAGIADVCRNILAQKIEFSEWLEEEVTSVTESYLALQERAAD